MMKQLTRSDVIITGDKGQISRGLNRPCYLCGKKIDNPPYLSHGGTGRLRRHYYHIQCAKKVHLL